MLNQVLASTSNADLSTIVLIDSAIYVLRSYGKVKGALGVQMLVCRCCTTIVVCARSYKTGICTARETLDYQEQAGAAARAAFKKSRHVCCSSERRTVVQHLDW